MNSYENKRYNCIKSSRDNWKMRARGDPLATGGHRLPLIIILKWLRCGNQKPSFHDVDGAW